MKTFFRLAIILSVFTSTLSCNLFKKKDDPTPIDTTPAYQKAITEKAAKLGWDKDGHSPYNGTAPVKTTGGKGWVQYYAYADKKTAIYYFEGKGAFAMDTEEMKAYDNVGQDNWGLVVSDPKATKSGGCGYNDIITTDGKEAIITCQNLVYGEIYAKYKELNRWDGPLGLPTTSELNLNGPTQGKYNAFSNGQIYLTSKYGATAFWGKVMQMYEKTGWDNGWLKLPTESCDPKKADNKQFVRFENGAIDAATCGNYYNNGGLIRYQNGTAPVGGAVPPCY